MKKPFYVNPKILRMEYAVRGPIPQRAAELKRLGRTIIPCNIGNPQALGQPPLSFYRQVLSLLEYPELLKAKNIHIPAGYSETALDYAHTILKKMETGMGAYSESKGHEFIREAIAEFIDRRDGVRENNGIPAHPDTIFLTDGASEGAKNIIELLITNDQDGIMIPIPQYPLYSATIHRCGGVQVNYYPDEEKGWLLSRNDLEESYSQAETDGVNIRGIVVINPGNPTGAVLNQESVNEVVNFAEDKGISIIADEVYQENTYGSKFHSFAQAVWNRPDVPLFSLHSVSKGFYGECGHRGGYLEVRNAPKPESTDETLTEVLFRQASVNLCSNTTGQILVYLMVNPPAENSSAGRLHKKEVEAVLKELHEKALIIKASFQEMEGVKCFGEIGAMYLFPRLDILPENATDYDYCMALLESTGLTTVNGSGFGQKEGTNHLRIAFLPPKPMLEEVLPKWVDFHRKYVKNSL
ncbi:MAG: aminotransferase class I/II-fold pyridoxal phosphate-dependent enzyme [Candidatus Marinimicrobia bacterium]|nr:aminotransferase class I/II-fold pyridoxal phosphate-dependent enzyme [Candidatus Neomarinimicrobiota bacterium]